MLAKKQTNNNNKTDAHMLKISILILMANTESLS